MKRCLFIFCIVMVSCDSKPELRVSLKKVNDTTSIDSVITMKEVFFDISLKTLTYNNGLKNCVATKIIKRSADSPLTSFTMMTILNDQDRVATFKNNTEFENFMRERGYVVESLETHQPISEYRFITKFKL